jgi:hypothetical protein
LPVVRRSYPRVTVVSYSSGMVEEVGEAAVSRSARRDTGALMAAAKPKDTRDWVAIRHAYEHSEETIKQICTRFGVTKGSLENRYRKDHWPSRRSDIAGRRRSTLSRLFAVLETQVGKLARADNTTLGDKEANQLTEMIKNFDKLTSMERADTDNGGPAQNKDMRAKREKLTRLIDERKRR